LIQKDNYNLGGEVEYLTVSGLHACLLISLVTPFPGTEVPLGKITGFDSGLHFDLPGFRLQQFNSKPWPPVVSRFSDPTEALNLFTADKVTLA
jgi:hypothetical protein